MGTYMPRCINGLGVMGLALALGFGLAARAQADSANNPCTPEWEETTACNDVSNAVVSVVAYGCLDDWLTVAPPTVTPGSVTVTSSDTSCGNPPVTQSCPLVGHWTDWSVSPNLNATPSGGALPASFLPGNCGSGSVLFRGIKSADCSAACDGALDPATVPVYVIKVELLSDSAANSPKAFTCGQTTVASPCGQETAQAEALIVYYSSVFNHTTKVVDDFDVTLRVSPTDVPSASWARVSGPNSGSLVNGNQAEAIYRNSKKGGVYLFDATVGSIVTRTQLWHPVAGPDISAFWNTEIGYFRNTWGPAYRTRLDERTVLLALWPVRRALVQRALAATDMLRIGNHLDWNGAIVGQYTPCAPPGWGYNLTIAGVVVEQHKWNNMMYAEIGREMGTLEAVLLRGGDPNYNPLAFGHPDTDAAREAYRAGFNLSDGASLETAIHDHGYGMQEPGSGTQREWPSDETSSGSLNRVGQQQLEGLLQ